MYLKQPIQKSDAKDNTIKKTEVKQKRLILQRIQKYKKSIN